MTILRLGILGCANIARAFARDLAGHPQIQIAAVASRDLAKAQAFAQDFGIARAHGSYEALLADADIDAIYNPLPNTLHAPWSVQAAQAGKHVLCEKPMAMTAAEVTAMFDAAQANQVVLIEAFPYLFQPQTTALLQCVRDGSIGELRSVQACFGFTVGNVDTNIRLKPELGGGALGDAGCYPLSLIRKVFDQAPAQVIAVPRWHASGVDIGMAATLIYADGRIAQMSCAMDGATHRRATIVGSAGTIDTEYVNHSTLAAGDNPHGVIPGQLRIRRGIAPSIPFEDIPAATGSGFRFAAEAFAAQIVEPDVARRQDQQTQERRFSTDNARVLEAIARSARERRPVDL